MSLKKCLCLTTLAFFLQTTLTVTDWLVEFDGFGVIIVSVLRMILSTVMLLLPVRFYAKSKKKSTDKDTGKTGDGLREP